MRRTIGYLLAALVVTGAALVVREKFFVTNVPLEAKVHTASVARGQLIAKITATGTLSALVTVQVGSQVSGRISELHADFNSQVKKGQLIARIDPELFVAAVEQAKANLVAAEGNLAKSEAQSADADRQAVREKALAARELVAQADLDTAVANADAARATIKASQGAVEQARASLHQAQINLAYTTIISPIDGVVISRNVDVGQTVAASLQAPVLFTIAEDLTRMQVDTNVAEADIGKLTPGMETSFTVDAYPTAPFKGRVRQIRFSPQMVQNVVTYDAVIDVENADLKLKPGMTATVTAVWAQADDALKVPNAALRFRPSADLLPPADPSAPGTGKVHGHHGDPSLARADRPDRALEHGGAQGDRGGSGSGGPKKPPRQVWVLRAGALLGVPVQTGITDGSFTEITGGEIKEGDEVVTETTGVEGPKAPGSPMGTQPMGGGMRRVL